MRNVVTFDVRDVFDCACVMNVLDGTTNTIEILFEDDETANPQIELTVGETTTTTPLFFQNGVAKYDLDISLFIENTEIYTRYIDGDKIGTSIEWYIIGKIPADGIPDDKTIRVRKLYNDRYWLQIVTKNDKPADTYSPDDFDITETGELKLKTPINVSVTTNSDDQVTNVDFEYKDNEHKSFYVEWNTDGKITKFGNLPIKWE